MTTALMLYLYLVVGDFLSTGSLLFTILSFVWLSIFLFAYMPPGDDDLTPYEKKFRWTVYVLLFFICINPFYPDKEQLAWIIGGSVAISIASTEEAKQLPENVLGAVNSFLKQMQEDEVNE